MRTVAIIQARMGSTRFPGKVMAMLAGKTVIQRVIERAERLNVDDIVVATTDREEDHVLIERPKDGALRFAWNGDPNDVLGRYVACAKDRRADRIVRITADCPLLDPDVGNRIIEALTPNVDYASNVIERRYPKGWDVEALWSDVLFRLDRMTLPRGDREHVTRYIRRNLDLFITADVGPIPPDPSPLNYCVDYPEDIARLERDAADLLAQ